MKGLSSIFKSLSDETRIHMLALLFNKEELCVCDFMNLLGITQSKASRHLRYMLHAGLLEDRRDAVWVHYRISKNLPIEQKALLNVLKKIFDNPPYRSLKNKLIHYLKQKNVSKTECPVA
jgi:ArsR family transcriptional regulator